MKKYKFIYLIILFIIPSLLLAQENQEEYKPIDFTVQLKNMHLWRGLEVTPEITLCSDLNIKDKTNTFKFGLWGGAGATGAFKEFDYYLSFSKKGFTLAVWDIYNFSPDATYNNSQIFNYKAKETGHFIDVSVAYRFQGKFPLSISWATVVYGRDRDGLNEKNRYTSYVSLDYPAIQNKDVNISLGIAGAFALSKGKDSGGKSTDAHFYGKSPGIVNVNITASKTLILGSYKLPVSVMAMWNPENNSGNIQLALNLF